MKWWRITGLLAAVAGVVAVGLFRLAPAGQAAATGFVFNDRDGDRKRDQGEPGIPNVRVSNGEGIVKTDRNGKWRLPVDDDTAFFVIKPRGWMTPLNDHNLP